MSGMGQYFLKQKKELIGLGIVFMWFNWIEK